MFGFSKSLSKIKPTEKNKKKFRPKNFHYNFFCLKSSNNYSQQFSGIHPFSGRGGGLVGSMVEITYFFEVEVQHMQLYKSWQFRPDRAGKFPSDLTGLATLDLARYSP